MHEPNLEEITAYWEFRERCATIAYCIAQDIIDTSRSITRTGNISFAINWHGLPQGLQAVSQLDFIRELRTKLALTLTERDRKIHLQQLNCTWLSPTMQIAMEDELLARFAGYKPGTDVVVEIVVECTVVRQMPLPSPMERHEQILAYLEKVRQFTASMP